MKFFQKSLVLSFALLSAFLVDAKIFTNSYLSFEMPENWNCKAFGTDWVCHSSLSKQQKEAMIILTAKQAGTLDTLESYESFLKKPRMGVTKANRSFQSKVHHSKQIFINGQGWVDSLHTASEIPNYFTRYVATVCCEKGSIKLGILVTYSAHKDHYSKYATDFLNSIESLRVSIDKKAFEKIQSLAANDSLGTFNPGSYINDLLEEDEDSLDGSGSSGLFGLPMEQAIGGLLILIVLAFLGLRMAKKKRRKKRVRK